LLKNFKKSFNMQLRLYRVTNLDLFDNTRKPYDKTKIDDFFKRKEINLVEVDGDKEILERVVKHILKDRNQVEYSEFINMVKILSEYKNI